LDGKESKNIAFKQMIIDDVSQEILEVQEPFSIVKV